MTTMVARHRLSAVLMLAVRIGLLRLTRVWWPAAADARGVLLDEGEFREAIRKVALLLTLRQPSPRLSPTACRHLPSPTQLLTQTAVALT
eukprot:10730979-Prorocentrum_lima.AAC.1